MTGGLSPLELGDSLDRAHVITPETKPAPPRLDLVRTVLDQVYLLSAKAGSAHLPSAVIHFIATLCSCTP